MNLSDDNKNEIKSSQMSGVLDEVDQNKTDSVQNLCGIAKKTSIGGQAVIEGVMMRGPEKIATAVRKPDGEIVVDEQPLGKGRKSNECYNLLFCYLFHVFINWFVYFAADIDSWFFD